MTSGDLPLTEESREFIPKCSQVCFVTCPSARCASVHTPHDPSPAAIITLPSVGTAWLGAFSSSFHQLPEELLLSCPWWPELTFGKQSPAILREGTLKQRS